MQHSHSAGSEEFTPAAKLALGLVVATPNALSHVSAEEISAAIQRHSSRDWGLVCKEDQQSNNEAFASGFRILSAYATTSGVRFWIITEADRSVTTVLMPEDY